MTLQHAINNVLVETLGPGIKQAVAGLVARGQSSSAIGEYIRRKFPDRPLTAEAAERFAELCWTVRRQRGPMQ